MNSIHYPPPSPFICPTIRMLRSINKRTIISETAYLIIDNSFQISDVEDDGNHHLRLFLGCNNKEGEQNDLYCRACQSYKIVTTYYFCNYCEYYYHKECVESPPIFISSFHPKYPLQLLQYYTGSMNKERQDCHSCGLKVTRLFYYSSVYDLVLDPVCARKREFSAINNPKRHEHMLHYFPRKASLTCNVCALDDNKHSFYSCLQCDFIVHVTCIYLPRVIQISYHNHRLSFTCSIPFQNMFCGVCRRKIKENYGGYSCSKDCVYAVHSKCATGPYVWDGKELEDQPEMEMIYDDIKSFEEIDDGIIRHFSHEHHQMRFYENTERVFDGEQHCQACILPLDDGNVYRCMQCDFILHEACANLPRIKHNMVHRHRLILSLGKAYVCGFCTRPSCGFKYMCSEECCNYSLSEGCCNYSLDVRCASLSERVDHPSHPHLLFLIFEREPGQKCSTCGRNFFLYYLNCAECDFILCSICATHPYKVKHEDDEHMLTLCYEKNESGSYWCQVCEETIHPKEGYYTCNECGVTFHIKCILGMNPYIKAGQSIELRGKKVEVILNNHLNRPICNRCQRRCPYKIVFKTSDGNIYCSVVEYRKFG